MPQPANQQTDDQGNPTVHTRVNRYPPSEDLSGYAWLSIAAAVLTLSLKGFAAWWTGSVGLLSDAAESVVNLVAAVLALAMLKIAVRPPDKEHPYGHSKAEYFSAAIEGAMIFAAAAVIIYTGIERLISPRNLEGLTLGLGLSVGASVINGVVAWVLLRKGRKVDSATLIADGKHLLTDVITSVAVILGVALVALTDIPRLDPIVAILAGLNILWTGFGLIRDSVNGLMDGALPEQDMALIGATLDQFRCAEIDFHAVRTRRSGNRIFLDLHVLVPGAWSVQQGHDLVEQLIAALNEELPALRVMAHLEPREDPLSYHDQEI